MDDNITDHGAPDDSGAEKTPPENEADTDFSKSGYRKVHEDDVAGAKVSSWVEPSKSLTPQNLADIQESMRSGLWKELTPVEALAADFVKQIEHSKNTLKEQGMPEGGVGVLFAAFGEIDVRGKSLGGPYDVKGVPIVMNFGTINLHQQLLVGLATVHNLKVKVKTAAKTADEDGKLPDTSPLHLLLHMMQSALEPLQAADDLLRLMTLSYLKDKAGSSNADAVEKFLKGEGPMPDIDGPLMRG